MLYTYNEEELRNICKKNIENLERWARRIIDECFEKQYGADWLECKTDNQEFLIKKELREKINNLKKQDNKRFIRTVDALFMEDIVYLMCTDKFYKLI